MNFANLITFSRIILSLFLCYILLESKNIHVGVTVGIFLAASLSDWLDGFLARKNNKITDFGKIFDPIADKILVFSVFICLVKVGFISAWAVIILLIREFLMSSARALLAKHGLIYSANIFGKLKTALQFFSILSLILAFYKVDFHNNICYNLGIFLMWVSVFISFISLFFCFYEHRNKFLKVFKGEL